ncbi:aminotransferase class I/II-fold pyridoxal phosphate-dependent enzyme [Catenuloplanes atrovinosus]
MDRKAGLRARAGLTRRLRPRGASDGIIDLAGNDYLGLSRHPRVVAAATEALRRYGAGATGSRLVRGSTELHAALEAALADWLGAESALVYSSGYLANLGAVRALVQPSTLLLADAHNHASLVDGVRLSGAAAVITGHNDPAGVRSALLAEPGRAALVITESVFSVDGDLAPLADLHAAVGSGSGGGMAGSRAASAGSSAARVRRPEPPAGSPGASSTAPDLVSQADLAREVPGARDRDPAASAGVPGARDRESAASAGGPGARDRAGEAVLLVDDAHALGVLGPSGAGGVAAAGLAGAPDVVVTATLSKALGAAGGVIAGPAALIRHLIDTGRTFIYDTALPPATAAAALAALDLARTDDAARTELGYRAALAHTRLTAAGLDAPPPAAGVLSVTAPGPSEAVAWAAECLEAGVAVGCFRPPTTPDPRSRLRLTINVGVPRHDFERALDVIVKTAPHPDPTR